MFVYITFYRENFASRSPLRPMAPSNPTYCDAPETEFGKPVRTG